MKKQNIIGVLGGMGPFASVEFLRILMEKSVRMYGASDNDHYPEVLLDSVPVVDFIQDTGKIDIVRNILIDRVKKLNIYGVTQICIACNTAHILLEDLRKASSVPVVSIMEEVQKVIEEKGVQRVGLLATPTTYRMNLFGNIPSGERVVFIPTKKEQQQFEGLIRAVIAGENIVPLSRKAKKLTERIIKDQQLDCVILGCTELPLLLSSQLDVFTVDTLDVLANAVLASYYARKEAL